MINEEIPISVKLTTEQKRRLAVVCRRYGISQSNLLRGFLEYCFSTEKQVGVWIKKNMVVEKKVLTMKK